MSPSETNTLEAAVHMFKSMWANGAYHRTTLETELSGGGVAPEIIEKVGLAQLKLQQKGVIKRIGPNIYDFAGRTPAIED
jgi:hypothetical protein